MNQQKEPSVEVGAFTSGAISSSPPYGTSRAPDTRHAMIALTSLIVASAALLLPQNTPPQQPLARRAILNQAASFAAAAALLPLPAIADLGDLDMGEAPPPVAMKVESLAIEPAADSGGGVALTMVDAGVKKKKEDTPASRIKELKAKGSLTDKERKELKRLIADEMCEMLGRGC